MSTPEGRVKNKIKKLLDRYERNVYCFMPVQMGLGARTVDYLGCVEGQFFAIEAKAAKGRTTAPQDIVLQRIRAAGGRTFVIVGEDDLDKLEEFLEGMMTTGSAAMNDVDVIRAALEFGEIAERTENVPSRTEIFKCALLAMAEMEAEIADLRDSVIAFGAPVMVQHARDNGLPEGHLFAAHYDILAGAGARMDNFTRGETK